VGEQKVGENGTLDLRGWGLGGRDEKGAMSGERRCRQHGVPEQVSRRRRPPLACGNRGSGKTELWNRQGKKSQFLFIYTILTSIWLYEEVTVLDRPTAI
jgi:hypothetical protein